MNQKYTLTRVFPRMLVSELHKKVYNPDNAGSKSGNRQFTH